MADVKVGDRVKRHVYYGMEGGTMLPAEEGTVVYVHPEGRFFTLEFTFTGPYGTRKFRESYPMHSSAEPDSRLAAPVSRPRGAVGQDGKGSKGKFTEHL